MPVAELPPVLSEKGLSLFLSMFANDHQKLSVSFNAANSRTAASMTVFGLFNNFNISFMDVSCLHFRLLSNPCKLVMEILTPPFNGVGIIPATIASGFAAKARPLYCPYTDNLGDIVKAEKEFGKSTSTKSGAVTAAEMEA